MLRKLALVAMSLSAMAAFAGPGIAQAESNWVHNGGGGIEGEEIALSGPISMEIPGAAGIDANVEATIELGANGSGTVTAFHVSGCIGTGQLAGLFCTATPTFPNWPATALANGTIEINIPTTNPLHNLYYANPAHTIGPVATTNQTGQIIAEPDNSTEIGSVELSSGEDVTWNGNQVSIGGELEVTENAGTFGIE